MDQIWSTWLLVQNCSVRQSALEGCIILITLLIFVSNVLFWSQCRCKILDDSQVSQETVHPRIHPVWETQEPLMRRFSNRPEPRDTTNDSGDVTSWHGNKYGIVWKVIFQCNNLLGSVWCFHMCFSSHPSICWLLFFGPSMLISCDADLKLMFCELFSSGRAKFNTPNLDKWQSSKLMQIVCFLGKQQGTKVN